MHVVQAACAHENMRNGRESSKHTGQLYGPEAVEEGGGLSCDDADASSTLAESDVAMFS